MDQRKHKGHLLRLYYRDMFKPEDSETFQEYRGNAFLPYAMYQLRNVEGLDVVLDRYLPTSFQDSARSKRGKGIREASDRTQGNWTATLRAHKNKQELPLYRSSTLS